ncbi:mediator of RNA polymerase II transcription subunit 22a [Trifolium repens]|nr:mediator of RNA polymerase II transcription subunit 22a [Trifolium repens]
MAARLGCLSDVVSGRTSLMVLVDAKVQAADSLLTLVPELKQTAIFSGFASLNDHVEEKRVEFNQLAEKTDHALSRIGEEVDGQINACWKHKMTETEIEAIKSAGFPVSVIHGRLAERFHPMARLVDLHAAHLVSHEQPEELLQFGRKEFPFVSDAGFPSLSRPLRQRSFMSDLFVHTSPDKFNEKKQQLLDMENIINKVASRFDFLSGVVPGRTCFLILSCYSDESLLSGDGRLRNRN